MWKLEKVCPAQKKNKKKYMSSSLLSSRARDKISPDFPFFSKSFLSFPNRPLNLTGIGYFNSSTSDDEKYNINSLFCWDN
jgi:hypothetical protein